QAVEAVPTGTIDPPAGKAAADFLNRAIDLALEGRVQAITTLPPHKESLRAGGVAAPGHTEILGRRGGVPSFAMMLYVGPPLGGLGGLGVVHATLHVALREVFAGLTTGRVADAIDLADRGMRPILSGAAPRIAVAGLNPHAGEHGLFGDE